MHRPEDIHRVQSAEDKEVITMDAIRHGMNGFRIPSYMEEILTNNYCPSFVRMSMVREGDSYRFTYRPGNLIKLNPDNLDTYGILMLLRSVIAANETAAGYLIAAENYLLEPELIYMKERSVAAGSIRIMFYPDVNRLRFSNKLTGFTGRIIQGRSKEERELLRPLIEIAESGDINKAGMFLDKNILRIENRLLSSAG